MLIYEHSKDQRNSSIQVKSGQKNPITGNWARTSNVGLPNVSELQAVRHYTRLSQLNFSIDTQFYPLGSCTMKYNPRVCNSLASLGGFTQTHPLAPENMMQGLLASLYDLQEMLKEVTGMKKLSLAPAAGAQGEFAGVAMIRAYHDARNDNARVEILVPDAAHGTNPASAVMCGYKIKEIPTNSDGDVDIDALKAAIGPQTAGIMLTNPSTLGVFESKIKEISHLVHAAGGLLYYDGANLNAILGKVKPGDMGFDVIHINLHKTFSTPHGGGGPGSGPVGVSARLVPHLPVPMVTKNGNTYAWETTQHVPKTIGKLMAFGGNIGILVRAYIYAKLLGGNGMLRVAEYATLNANYIMAKLKDAGFDLAFTNRRASHEFIITLKNIHKETGVSAMDFAKRLLDLGFHAPTTYFPLLVPECLLIEPTETEAKDDIDGFIQAMIQIKKEAYEKPDFVKGAPYTQPVRRLDDVKAARELNLRYEPK